ncbi:MAG: hypothetical protein H8E90_08265 [Anaerolineales bacterium]|nr:hypothetical protein [Anaerolineales bacterium]
MKFEVPEVRDVVTRMLEVEASFDGTRQEIYQWLKDHRRRLERNKQLVAANEYVQVLIIFLPDLLIRGMRGEAGSKVRRELKERIKEEADLRKDIYQRVLKKANYRWGEKGVQVIEDVVRIFRDDYGWDWGQYFEEAEAEKETNFLSDKLLKVKYIGFKVRDLALLSFNENYIANDRNVVRVITRLGFLNYGFELWDDNLEMGTDLAKRENYLFLHRLALQLSALTDGTYSPSDLDRIFWHFGRSRCEAKPQCGDCPVAKICPTGRFRIGKS